MRLGDKIIVSCFDLVTDEEKVNTAHEMPRHHGDAGRGALAKHKARPPQAGAGGLFRHTGEEALSGVNDNLAGLLLDDVVRPLP